MNRWVRAGTPRAILLLLRVAETSDVRECAERPVPAVSERKLRNRVAPGSAAAPHIHLASLQLIAPGRLESTRSGVVAAA